MRFEIVTLFPELFDVLRTGLLGKAQEAGAIDVEAITPREFTQDRHRTVDDSPYGGGSGMVLMPGPIAETLDHLDEARGGTSTHRVLLTPQGARFSQAHARRFSELDSLTLVCGRYEGFDERIRGLVDEEVSLGDFVLLGGEAAALGGDRSHRTPPAGRPRERRVGRRRIPRRRSARVPAVHASRRVPGRKGARDPALGKPRRDRTLETEGIAEANLERRPDLLETAELTDEDRKLLEEIRAGS